MHETPTRAEARAQERRAQAGRAGLPIARHGRLRPRRTLTSAAALAGKAVAVVAVSAGVLAAYAALDVVAAVSSKDGVQLVDEAGKPLTPHVGAVDGAFNVLLAGSDSGGGNPAYDVRDAALNDVTMLLHVSADHKNATVVSLPRDMYVPIPSCPKPDGGSHGAMSRQKLNTTLSYGGLACTVLTVKQLTGLEIDYAGVIEFDGVIEMSNAVGGVPVCVGGDIFDKYTGLDVKAGENTLQGQQALAFLRSRYAVGDGSDLARISNQQVFLSSLVRTIQSADTLANPVKVYALAKAAADNILLSESLKDITTIASLGVALKNVDVSKVVFVQYPNQLDGDGVAPTADEAELLMSALREDRPVTLTGDTGLGSEAAPGAEEPAPAPAETEAPAGEAAVELPSNVHGQTAAQVTCTRPYYG
ncbi:LCP family protein [Leifsonia shinshuensis]|uniref:LCP family protein required for cell wall assembly n=1 Tax=Leifsonia shinshuensis TaxID=150026 RepID=A0A853CMU9_9MICO|nr:LCP family protein [Leifsonia shinshuensis]NYJ21792.1 LCP family protein required for cell wall assembly [Leifsonia shinshuensis]